MLALQELLREPFEVRVEGEGAHMQLVESGGDIVRLELVRCKNKSSPKAVGAPFAAPCGRYIGAHVLRCAQGVARLYKTPAHKSELLVL